MHRYATASKLDFDEALVSPTSPTDSEFASLQQEVSCLRFELMTFSARLEQGIEELRSDFRGQRAEHKWLRERIDRGYTALDTKIDKGRENLDARIDALDRKIDRCRETLDAKIEATRASLERKINATNDRVDRRNERL